MNTKRYSSLLCPWRGVSRWGWCLVVVVLLCGACKKHSLQDELDGWLPQLTEMAELGTVEYTINKIVSVNDNDEWYKLGDRMILFTTTSYVKAGVDMAMMSLDKVVVDEASRSVVVRLPHAKVLSFNMPPDEVKMTYKKISMLRSDFDAKERNKLLVQAEKQIRTGIPKMGILQEAEENAKESITAMLRQLGFEKVTVKFE